MATVSIGTSATMKAGLCLSNDGCSIMENGARFKQYLGGWHEGLQHVSLSDCSAHHLLKLGGTQGQGTYFYSRDGQERYEGEWAEGQRSGWGRMAYSDGSIYEGEWIEDVRSGLGLLLQGELGCHDGSTIRLKT
jgi:hypothetical protein